MINSMFLCIKLLLQKIKITHGGSYVADTKIHVIPLIIQSRYPLFFKSLLFVHYFRMNLSMQSSDFGCDFTAYTII